MEIVGRSGENEMRSGRSAVCWSADGMKVIGWGVASNLSTSLVGGNCMGVGGRDVSGDDVGLAGET